MSGIERLDLLVLAADKDAEQMLRAALGRPDSLAIPKLSFKIVQHPNRDNGCAHQAEAIMRPLAQQYRRGLVVLDHHGSGREEAPREELEAEIQDRLERCGWEGRVAVIVIAPELEQWLWSRSNEVDGALRWPTTAAPLRDWLKDGGHPPDADGKPQPPKEALERALRHLRRPRSPSLYGAVASRVSLSRCADPAWQKLRETLQQWFGRSAAQAGGR